MCQASMAGHFAGVSAHVSDILSALLFFAASPRSRSGGNCASPQSQVFDSSNYFKPGGIVSTGASHPPSTPPPPPSTHPTTLHPPHHTHPTHSTPQRDCIAMGQGLPTALRAQGLICHATLVCYVVVHQLCILDPGSWV